MIKSPLFSCRAALLAAAVGVFVVSANGQTPLLHYTLDGTLDDFGSLNVEGSLVNQANYSASGTGFGRFDRALSTADGTQDYFLADTSNSASLAMNAMTMAMWVNIGAGATNDRLVSNLGPGGGGFDLYLNNVSGGAFQLSYGFNTAGSIVTSSNAQYVMGDWLFIAVTYDGANVRFYSGTDEVSLNLNTTLGKTGGITASATGFEIGGTPVTDKERSPVALFNDVRIYGEALSETQLEAIRQSAIIPEPSTYAMIFGVLALGFVAVRKRRRC